MEYRSIDGTGNNLDNTELGSTGEQLLRVSPADYGDGISSLAGQDRPSPREVSNALSQQSYDQGNGDAYSDMLWLWGQFVDHDLDLTPGRADNGTAAIAVPAGDPWFDPNNTGTQSISFNRSDFDPATGTESGTARQQITEITSWLDASNVYGSDAVRAAALRGENGTLKISEGNLLPYNLDGLPNDMTTSPTHFLAGDIRANENVGLTSMHTVFVREHNRIVEELQAENPALSGEELYQQARAYVGAEIQAITYNEFLPKLIGPNTIDFYNGYDATVDPSIANEFSTVAYRVGHTMLSRQLERFAEDGTVHSEGHLDLREAFFHPDHLTAEGGVEDILRGSAASLSNEIDTKVIDDVRSMLFGAPGSGGLDLVSLNIQRGRDHGITDYNSMREAYGLERVASFADITSDTDLQARLEELYGTVDNIDAYAGGLAEDHAAGAVVGPLFQTAIADQFTRLRDGDRFWHENQFDEATLAEIQDTTLADVLTRNTSIEHLQEDVFTAYSRTGGTSADDDLYITGAQNDLAFGGEGNDSIASNIGNDQLQGEGGNDRLFGGEGDDVLQGGVGDDQLHGEADNDRLEGGTGNDFLSGDEGHDRLDGGEGNDYLLGGNGNDRFVFSAGYDQVGDFEKGPDKVDFSSWDLVNSIDDLAITSYIGGGTLLEDSAGNSLWLAGVDSVTQNDFLFAPETYDAETNTGGETETGTGETGTGGETGTETGTETGGGTETETGSGTGSETSGGTETGTGETGSGTGTETSTETGGETDDCTEMETGAGTETGAGGETGSGAGTETGTETGTGMETGTGISGGANEALVGTEGDDLFINTEGIQYVHGLGGCDRFQVDENRAEWNIGRTQDNQDWVIWNDEGEFNVLFDVEEIEFNDEVVQLNDYHV